MTLTFFPISKTLPTTPQLCKGTPSRLRSSSMSQTDSASPTDQIGQAAHDEGVHSGNADDILVQYVVLRRDLIDSWHLGSVVTQGCHASVSVIWSNKDDPHTIQYCSPSNIDSMHKVTLEVKGETQTLNLSEKLKTDGIIPNYGSNSLKTCQHASQQNPTRSQSCLHTSRS